jgi:hypothetical protein
MALDCIAGNLSLPDVQRGTNGPTFKQEIIITIMTRINYLALIAMNLLGIIFIYKRLHNDSDPWLQSVLVPLGIAVLTFNLPVLIACGIDYLFNKKFNARMFNNIVYFFIVTLLLAFFFPGILKMR